MGEDEPSMEELRVELSNLRDDLAVIESSAIFFVGSTGNQDAIDTIKRSIAEIESILERNHK